MSQLRAPFPSSFMGRIIPIFMFGHGTGRSRVERALDGLRSSPRWWFTALALLHPRCERDRRPTASVGRWTQSGASGRPRVAASSRAPHSPAHREVASVAVPVMRARAPCGSGSSRPSRAAPAHVLPAASAAAAGRRRQASQSRAQVLAYWTPARMQGGQAARLRLRSRCSGFHPDAKPAPAAAGGGTVTGASWPASASDPITGPPAASCSRWAAATGSAPARSRRTHDPAARSCSPPATASSTNDGRVRHELDVHPGLRPRADLHLRQRHVRLLDRRRRSSRDAEFATAGGFNDTAVSTTGRFAVVASGGKQASSTAQLDTTVGGTFAARRSPASRRARR